MEVWRNGDAGIPQGGILTLGFFDGLHVGHVHLLRRLLRLASERGRPAICVTLWPHPRIVLGKAPGRIRLINDLESKLSVLRTMGLDGVYLLDFTLELSRIAPYDFLEEVLYAPLRPEGILMGYDHRFGAGGAGNFSVLQEFAQARGLEAWQDEAITVGGEEVSSTLARKAIIRGDMERVRRLLGRDFGFKGEVIPGRQLGRSMGYPTANIKPGSGWQQLPGYGVYEGVVNLPGEKYSRKALINVGTRPTIDPSGEACVEAHILDFVGNLYGSQVEVIFQRKIRDELRFSSVDDLEVQIGHDLDMLKHHTKGGNNE